MTTSTPPKTADELYDEIREEWKLKAIKSNAPWKEFLLDPTREADKDSIKEIYKKIEREAKKQNTNWMGYIASSSPEMKDILRRMIDA
jgi:23S rRNA G2445 N2-methylase RlmL